MHPDLHGTWFGCVVPEEPPSSRPRFKHTNRCLVVVLLRSKSIYAVAASFHGLEMSC